MKIKDMLVLKGTWTTRKDFQCDDYKEFEKLVGRLHSHKCYDNDGWFLTFTGHSYILYSVVHDFRFTHTKKEGE